MARRNDDELFPSDWTTTGVNPKNMKEEVIKTDKWDREDRQRMLKEVPAFSAARKKLGQFASTGEAAMSDMFAALLKAEPELDDSEKIQPRYLVNRRIMEQALDLDVTDRLRHYTVNDDVQSALSCEEIEPDMETLFDMTRSQQAKAEQLQQALQQLAQAQQEQIDLDDLVEKWTQDQGLDGDDECQTCQGTGQVPQDGQEGDDGAGGDQGDQGDDSGDSGSSGDSGASDSSQGGDQGSGSGDPSGQQGGGQGTQPCPDCGGSGSANGQPQPGQGAQGGQPQKGSGRGKELTPEQRQQLDEFAKQQEQIRQQIEQLQEQAAQAGEDFEKEMNQIKATMRGHISDMLDKAEEAARESNEIAMTWGMEPGELQRLPAQERMDLAKRLNNERFRRVAKLFGPMKNMMLSEQQRKVVHTAEEVYDVTIGNHIGRLLPQEVINLRPGPTRLDFLRRFTEGQLLEYDLQGQEKLAKGGIIFCEDGSGSMRGERELWAKAVMLCLLHLARQQKRSFHLIHFGSPGQFKHIGFEKPEDFTLDRILDAAELFFNGGTDFATPMKESMKLLDAEVKSTGRTKADVVFVTDDECWVDADFMDKYLEFMHKVQSTTWGVSVSGADRREGALDTMTEGKVAVIADFFTGEDIRSIFRGV